MAKKFSYNDLFNADLQSGLTNLQKQLENVNKILIDISKSGKTFKVGGGGELQANITVINKVSEAVKKKTVLEKEMAKVKRQLEIQTARETEQYKKQAAALDALKAKKKQQSDAEKQAAKDAAEAKKKAEKEKQDAIKETQRLEKEAAKERQRLAKETEKAEKESTKERLKIIKEQQKEQQKIIREQEKEQQRLAKEQNRLLREQQKEQDKLIKEQQKQQQQQEAKIQKQIQAEQQLQVALTKEVKSIKDLKEQTNALIKVRDRLDLTTKDGIKQYDLLTQKIKSNTDALKRHDAAIGSHVRNVGNYKSALQGVTSALSGLASGFGLMTGAFAALQIIQDATNTIISFEQQITNVAAVSGASSDELELLRQNAINVASSTKFAAQSVAELQFELAKLGFSTKEINQSTQAIVNLSIATGEDLARSTEIAASTLRAFGLDASEMTRVTDVMAQTFNISGSGLSDFAESIKYVSPVARDAGMSIEQTAALIGTLADNGIKGSMAGTALRRVFMEMAKSGRTGAEGLKEMSKSGITVADAYDEVGLHAVTALKALSNNQDKIHNFTTALYDAKGSAEATAKVMQNTLAGALDRLKAAYNNLFLISDKTSNFSKTAAVLVNTLTEVINNLNLLIAPTAEYMKLAGELVNAVKELIGVFDDSKEPISAVKTAFEGIAFVIRFLMLPLKTVIRLFTEGVAIFKEIADGSFSLSKKIEYLTDRFTSFRGALEWIGLLPKDTEKFKNFAEAFKKGAGEISEAAIKLQNAFAAAFGKKRIDIINENTKATEKNTKAKKELTETEKKLLDIDLLIARAEASTPDRLMFLNAQLKFEKERLKLLTENTTEYYKQIVAIRNLETEIMNLQDEQTKKTDENLNKLQQAVERYNNMTRQKKIPTLQELLGLDDKQFENFKIIAEEFKKIGLDIFETINKANQDAANKQIEESGRRIESLQNEINSEREILNQRQIAGLAYDESRLKSLQENLKREQIERKKHEIELLKIQRRAIVLQIIADTASSISSAVKNSQGNSLNAVTAGVAGAIQLAVQLAVIGKQMATAKKELAQIEQFAEGGEIGGKKHKDGGTLIEAEKGEYVINANSYEKSKKITKLINDGVINDTLLSATLNGLTVDKSLNINNLTLDKLMTRTANATENLYNITKDNYRKPSLIIKYVN